MCAINSEMTQALQALIAAGELHFGFTPKMLFEPHESKPWNPWIAKVFHRRGITKTWGRGTLKIASLMQAAGLPVPTLQECTESVVMTFVLPHHLGGANGLFAYIQANPGQRAGEMAVTFAVTQRTIERLLKQLKENGLVEFKGATKTGGYHATVAKGPNRE